MIRSRLLALGAILVFLVTTGALCGGQQLPAPDPFTLEIWRAEDSDADLAPAIAAYKAKFPHVRFVTRVLKPEEYEDELFRAWSKGEGPDIFSVPNWRLGKYKEFITPMPAVANLSTAYVVKKFGKQKLIVEPRTTLFPSIAQMQNMFVDVVSTDVVFDEQVYALPYSIDTLGLYYNRTLMAKAQVAVPPTNWEELRNDVQAMVVRDDQKKIIVPAAAIGTASNIPHFFDLVSVLMMQNGTVMSTGRGDATFAEEVARRSPGVESLDFYLKFSSPTWVTYTWDDTQLNALEAFTQGNLGFYFGYYSDFKTIQDRNSNLNFSYSKLPQIDLGNPVNIAKYAVETVHINSEHPDYAWDFINFAAAQENVGSFLESTGRVSAIRALVGEAQNDPKTASFAQQALTARSWYHGHSPDSAELAISDMIDEGIVGTEPLVDIAARAQARVNVTIE